MGYERHPCPLPSAPPRKAAEGGAMSGAAQVYKLLLIGDSGVGKVRSARLSVARSPAGAAGRTVRSACAPPPSPVLPAFFVQGMA